MKKINILAILSFFFAILPFILFLNLAIFDPFDFLDDINYLLLIYSLLIAPSVALILGIIVLIYRKSSSKSFILLAIIGILIALGINIFLYIDIFTVHPTKARDPRREGDIRQISLAMEMYYDQYNQYLQSETLPNAIGNYLNPMPQDPGNGPCLSYQWISNISDPEQYCIWACLETNSATPFFAASEKGTAMLEKAPTSLDCW